jgi:hypothetical protein
MWPRNLDPLEQTRQVEKKKQSCECWDELRDESFHTADEVKKSEGNLKRAASVKQLSSMK